MDERSFIPPLHFSSEGVEEKEDEKKGKEKKKKSKEKRKSPSWSKLLSPRKKNSSKIRPSQSEIQGHHRGEEKSFFTDPFHKSSSSRPRSPHTPRQTSKKSLKEGIEESTKSKTPRGVSSSKKSLKDSKITRIHRDPHPDFISKDKQNYSHSLDDLLPPDRSSMMMMANEWKPSDSDELDERTDVVGNGEQPQKLETAAERKGRTLQDRISTSSPLRHQASPRTLRPSFPIASGSLSLSDQLHPQEEDQQPPGLLHDLPKLKRKSLPPLNEPLRGSQSSPFTSSANSSPHVDSRATKTPSPTHSKLSSQTSTLSCQSSRTSPSLSSRSTPQSPRSPRTSPLSSPRSPRPTSTLFREMKSPRVLFKKMMGTPDPALSDSSKSDVENSTPPIPQRGQSTLSFSPQSSRLPGTNSRSPSPPSPLSSPPPAVVSPTPFLAMSPTASGNLSRFFRFGSSIGTAPRKQSFSYEEKRFQGDEYEEIVCCLTKMDSVEKKDFFVAFDIFQIDKEKLLSKMEMMIQQSGDGTRRTKKAIIRIAQTWWEMMYVRYRVSDPSFASQLDKFLDSLEPTLTHYLVWRGMNLMRCGSSSLVAQSMTAIMFRVFQNLQPSEFHEGAWEKTDTKYSNSPNLILLADYFNRLSSMVAESILFCEGSRGNVLTYMIKLAKRFLKLHNFEGLAAVMSGLNRSFIRRIKPLWVDLNQKYKRAFELMDEILSPELNFKGYRAALLTSEPPVLPWVAPKLRDLRFLYDGNQLTLKDGSINLSHLMAIGASISSFLDYQKIEYENVTTEHTSLLRYLRYRSLSEEVCYQQSLNLFPLKQTSFSRDGSFGKGAPTTGEKPPPTRPPREKRATREIKSAEIPPV